MHECPDHGSPNGVQDLPQPPDMDSDVGRQFRMETSTKHVALPNRNDIADCFTRIYFSAHCCRLLQPTGQDAHDIHV